MYALAELAGIYSHAKVPFVLRESIPCADLGIGFTHVGILYATLLLEHIDQHLY